MSSKAVFYPGLDETTAIFEQFGTSDFYYDDGVAKFEGGGDADLDLDQAIIIEIGLSNLTVYQVNDPLRAEAAADRAEAAASEAESSEQNAGTSASSAAFSANAAHQSELASAASQAASAQSEQNAAQSEQNAAQSEQNAAQSEANAASSAQAAATSEQNANQSEANAAASAQAAATSEQNAADSEAAAAASEANAADSEAAAAASEANAALSEQSATTSKIAAASSEANAAGSASAAALSEQNASASEVAAALSEANARTSELNVETHRQAVEQARDDAVDAKLAAQLAEANTQGLVTETQGYRDQASNVLTALQSSYLLAQASDPTVDLNGDPIDGGEVYVNTTTGKLRVYNGNQWVDLALDNTELETRIQQAVDELLAGATDALDTLNELAVALGNDPNFATTVSNALAARLEKSQNLADLPNKQVARENLGADDAGNLTKGILPAGRFNDTSHGVRGGGNLHTLATIGSAGFMSPVDKTKLEGIEIGADVTDAVNVGAAIASSTAKTTPADADVFAGLDSAASNTLKKFSWANIKLALKTYFDAIYSAVGHVHAFADLTSKPTTIGGYGITDAYTITQIDTTISGISSTLATKLNASAYTAADVLEKLKTVDGDTSGVDADLLDGQHGTYYRNAANLTGNFAYARFPTNAGEWAFNAGVGPLVFRTTVNPASGAPIFEVRSSGHAVRLQVQHDGKVVGDAFQAVGDVTAFSDRRLKRNIQKIDAPLEKVSRLSGYTFDRIDVEQRQTGVIAQEVLQVMPELVHGSKKTNYSVAYGNFAGLFIEAIKELKTIVEAQAEEIDELRSRLDGTT